jgi:hypothetical protein
LDTSDWVLRSEEDKNQFGREPAIEGEARDILERQRAELRPGDIFIFGREVWNATLADMELPTGKAGSRRRRRSALCGARGMSEERAMFFSGHRTSSRFRRYEITARDDNRKDVVRVSEYRKKRFADSEGEKADKSAKVLRIPR